MYILYVFVCICDIDFANDNISGLAVGKEDFRSISDRVSVVCTDDMDE